MTKMNSHILTTGGTLNVSVKIGVIFPSRGLVFSRTAQELLDNLKGYDYEIFFSHGRPIPDCFETPLQMALFDANITHIWIVEDDMVLPKDILKKLLAVDKAVVTADYPITKEGRGSVFRDASKKVLFCGTGCLLIKREVFNELKSPYFRSDTKWNVKNYGKYIKFTAVHNESGDGYGLHDITFCFELNDLNIPIHVIPTKLGQRKLVELGKSGTNNGAHQIETWTEIIKDKRLKEIQEYPVEKSGDLVEVRNGDEILNVSKEHAAKLIKAGKAEAVPKKKSYIDWGKR